MCKNLTICCNNLDAVMFDLNGVLVVAFNYSVLFVLFFLFFAISENIIHAYCIRLHLSYLYERITYAFFLHSNAAI
jgi:hypothetical protein